MCDTTPFDPSHSIMLQSIHVSLSYTSSLLSSPCLTTFFSLVMLAILEAVSLSEVCIPSLSLQAHTSSAPTAIFMKVKKWLGDALKIFIMR